MSDRALTEDQLRARIRNFEELAKASAGYLRPVYEARAEEYRRLLNEEIERRR